MEPLYAADAVVLHNVDEHDRSRDEVLQQVTTMHSMFEQLQHLDVRRSFFDSGFVQQHVLVGSLKSGDHVRLPVCQVVRVKGGLVQRVDEYYHTRYD